MDSDLNGADVWVFFFFCRRNNFFFSRRVVSTHRLETNTRRTKAERIDGDCTLAFRYAAALAFSLLRPSWLIGRSTATFLYKGQPN